ncbi:hypothetical protein BJY01DRAFT_250523 [Aspergillus pseudoustus]|uniref:Uncharacterized protein n=1 Tax=Aspergillus pseudoustus TaxID=1810923 RepID=A0ABR4JH42_9EURO
MADQKIALPSITEIEASTDILSDGSRSVKVVRGLDGLIFSDSSVFTTNSRYGITELTDYASHDSEEASSIGRGRHMWYPP